MTCERTVSGSQAATANSSVNCGTKRSKLSILSSTSISFPESGMSEARDCVVKLVDDHGVEHSVRVQVESVYEVALRDYRH